VTIEEDNEVWFHNGNNIMLLDGHFFYTLIRLLLLFSRH